MSAHARVSPSGADGWWTCAGKLNAEEGLPDNSSREAAEGTAAHQISNDCLTLGMEPYDFIGSMLKVEDWTFEWTDEDAEYMVPGLDQTRDFGGHFFGEHRVDLSPIYDIPDQFGTLDRAVVTDDLIVVSDLKWGRGIPVSPVANKQLQLYALGFWNDVACHLTKATDFLIIIDQPRCSGGGGEWRTTLDALLAFGEEARIRAHRTLDPNAPRTASEKGCMWCRRREAPGGCATYDEFVLDMLGMQFEDIDDNAAICAPPYLSTGMTPERRSYILEHKKMIEQWLELQHANCLDDALRGLPTPGRKAVEGRHPPRKWRDPEAADGALLFSQAFGLIGNRFTQKLKSPTQVEKEIGKDTFTSSFGKLVDAGTPKPILVPEADARPALLSVDQKFEDMHEECDNG